MRSLLQTYIAAAVILGGRAVASISQATPSVSVPVPVPVPNIATGQWLRDDEYPMAKCLDGSDPMYYIRPATSATNATKWVVHIQGGAWCTTDKACTSRSRTHLGSTLAQYGDNATLELGTSDGCLNNRWCGALMMTDPVANLLSHDWNAVWIRYCDGASFTGNAAEQNATTKLWYRGWHNLAGVFDDLEAKHNLKAATTVLFGGDSAGGLATFVHADWVEERITRMNAAALVVAMPDSGYWPDLPGGFNFPVIFPLMLQMHNASASLPKTCLAKNPNNHSKCLFPQYFASDMKVRLFPLQSLYDPDQTDQTTSNQHGKWMLDEIVQNIVTGKPLNGAWVHSCSRHCGAELLTINGSTFPEAVSTYLLSNQGKMWLQNAPYPCEHCCNDGN